MKFLDVTKPLVTQIILEAENKNTHLEHLEDHIFNKGYDGAKEAVDYLHSLHEMLEGSSKTKISMTTKWDGAPAIVCGRDPESGKFFVGTKGVFAQRPKLNFTDKDILQNHPDPGLQEILKVALQNLSKLNIDTVVQGDMLFKKDTVQTGTIDGDKVVYFKPNTIIYAVPQDSELAKQIQQAEMGIVFHTEYVGGPTLADTSAKFGYNSNELNKNPDVWFRDATIKDLSGTVTLTEQESVDLIKAITDANSYLTKIGKPMFDWIGKGSDVIGKDFIQYLKAHVNSNIRQGYIEQEPAKFASEFTQSYIARMEKKIEGYKTEKKQEEYRKILVEGVKFLKEHVNSIVGVYDLYTKLIGAKNLIVQKLETIRQMPTFKETENGFEVTAEEGFVAVDRTGNALKIIDRLEFSRLNFGSGRPGE
tara:strand:- start:8238 stop:9497 length:1260 start_codon:yes stop_codon:yes gene_type:complete